MAPNIALVTLDTLRFDAFTNHFDWLDGLRFSNAYSTSHWTIPAHGSLFSGKYPSEIGVHSKSPSLDCPETVLAEQLTKEGYTTRMWSANPNMMFWEGWDRGFDEVFGPGTLNPKHIDVVDWTAFLNGIDTHSWTKYPKAVWHAVQADCSTVAAFQQGYRRMTKSDADGGGRDVLERIGMTDIGDQEFVFINLMEAHGPYHPPDSSSAPVNVVIGDAFADSVTNPEEIRDAYSTSVAYLSDIYQKIYEKLLDEFDYVITVSDHGEMLGEHGMWNHGYGLYKELVHVPIVISGDNVESRAEDATVSLVDVYQTIVDLAGCEVESRGQSLLGDVQSRDYLTEYHGFLERHRTQFERKSVPMEIFDERDTPLNGVTTKSGFYGYQSEDSFRTHGTADRNDPEALMEELLSERDVRTVEEGDMEVTDEVQERLERLGYA
ncbi:hypothetical protein BG842_03880 [Haladaptatus sp. W1]|uniref:sulfatase-like hydrolase/transferase n=1 Tax=Haladaptatus sp. W1 TaxID=1897478 RepID=UPI0008497899|nr:sulfatase-like hydrolase/transferase [Haladaptatus sp. W1]ODR80573.1 hypothetical protein BG842_03880 [Haladaptatus sp. W1]